MCHSTDEGFLYYLYHLYRSQIALVFTAETVIVKFHIGRIEKDIVLCLELNSGLVGVNISE